jgi:hypothetical protein
MARSAFSTAGLMAVFPFALKYVNVPWPNGASRLQAASSCINRPPCASEPPSIFLAFSDEALLDAIANA